MKLQANKHLKVVRAGEELLLYTKATHEIHRLDARAAFVFERCDGETPLAEIVSAAQAEWKDPGSAQFVEGTAALLLDKDVLVATSSTAGFSRRRVLAKTAALVAAGVTTMLAPSPAQAQSAGGGGE